MCPTGRQNDRPDSLPNGPMVDIAAQGVNSVRRPQSGVSSRSWIPAWPMRTCSRHIRKAISLATAAIGRPAWMLTSPAQASLRGGLCVRCAPGTGDLTAWARSWTDMANSVDGKTRCENRPIQRVAMVVRSADEITHSANMLQRTRASPTAGRERRRNLRLWRIPTGGWATPRVRGQPEPVTSESGRIPLVQWARSPRDGVLRQPDVLLDRPDLRGPNDERPAGWPLKVPLPYEVASPTGDGSVDADEPLATSASRQK